MGVPAGFRTALACLDVCVRFEIGVAYYAAVVVGKAGFARTCAPEPVEEAGRRKLSTGDHIFFYLCIRNFIVIFLWDSN